MMRGRLSERRSCRSFNASVFELPRVCVGVRFGSFPSIVVLGPFLPSTSLARHLRLYSHRQSCSSDVALVSVIVSVIVSSPAVAGFSPLSFVSVVPVITVVGACPLSSSLSSAARGITRPSHRFLSSSPLFICGIFTYPSSSLSSSVVPVIVCRRRCPFLVASPSQHLSSLPVTGISFVDCTDGDAWRLTMTAGKDPKQRWKETIQIAHPHTPLEARKPKR